MEQKLNFNVIFPLKEMILRRLVFIFFTNSEILASFNKVHIQDKVNDILKLGLPPMLTQQMMNVVTIIELEIRNWQSVHRMLLNLTFNCFDGCILEQVHWTALGKIDYRKTAENLILRRMLSIHLRYKLASVYCLEDSIPALWEKLPNWRKKYLFEEDPFDYGTVPPLKFCWPYILKGETFKLDILAERTMGYPITFNRYAFQYAVRKGNKVATEYFFQKLTNVEREACLLQTVQAALRHRMEDYSYRVLKEFPEEELSETIFYLLSLINPAQVLEICKGTPCGILLCLLDRQSQSYFWDAVDFIGPFLVATDYAILLNRIAQKINLGYYPTKLFRDFFVRGSGDFKKHFVDKEIQSVSTLRAYFDLQDSEIIQFIFKSLDSLDRKRLLSNKLTFKLFYDSILKGNWHFVQLCLHKVMFCKEDKEYLKDIYCGFLTETIPTTLDDNLKEHIWKIFRELFDKKPGEDS